VALYNLATVYIQPSFYEGFGLTILEAMACETPVIIAQNNALVEISNGSALIANPKDYNEFSKNIVRVIKDSSENVKYKRLGKSHVKKFSWEKCAKETLSVYEGVLGIE
jgi:glycosyltransferase involved in cell wall biosynthesis